MPSTLHKPILIDTDVTPAGLPKSRALALRNVTPERGYLGLTAGTVTLPASLPVPVGANAVVGSKDDPDGQSVVYFLCNSAGQHRLLRFFPATLQTVALLAPPLLDLRATDDIVHVGIVGDYLAWLDRDGVQYRINMAVAGAGGYAAVTDPTLIRLLRPVPLYPLEATRINSPGPGGVVVLNRIGDDDWQFSYRYGYDDNDVTVLAPYSPVVRATTANRTTNAVVLAIPLLEVPSALVQRVEVYGRKNASALWQKIKVLKRDGTGAFPRDPVSGIPSRISFQFFGQTLGETLAADTADKLVEAIPDTSQALGAARSRFFLGNNKRGKAPTAVALSVAVENTDETIPVSQKRVYQVKITYTTTDPNGFGQREGYVWFVLISGTHGQSNARYVNYAPNFYLGVAFEVVGAKQFTRAELPAAADRILQGSRPGKADYQRVSVDQDGLFMQTVPFVAAGVGVRRLKGNSTYQVGVQFFGYGGQTSGTLTSDTAVVSVGDLPLDTTAITGTQLRWALTTGDAHAEIPDWAQAYQVVLTPSQTYTTFRQLHVAEVLRLKAGSDPDKPEFVELLDSGGNLWLDISQLATGSSGYTWSNESQDRVRIWEAPNSPVFHDYRIAGQVGEWLLVDEPVPVVYPRMTRLEIYSLRDGGQTTFYEAGPRYPVLRDGAGLRSYGVLTGTVEGDVWVKTDLRPGLTGITGTVAGAAADSALSMAPEEGGTFVASEGLYVPPGYSAAVVYTGYYSLKAGDLRQKGYGLYPGTTQQNGIAPTYTNTAGLPGFFEVVSLIPANEGRWLNDRGRPSAVLVDGPPLPAHLTTEVCWGGVLLPGSRINGLSSFTDGDVVTLPEENGPVTALVLGNQQQSTGTVLVGWQAHGGASLYLGESMTTQTTGGTLQVDSSRVVGTVRPLAGKRGTVHPGSIAAWDGTEWAWDAEHGEVLRYDQSGITALATTYHGRALCRELAAAFPTARVSGGYDPEAQVYYLTFTPLDPDATPRTIGFSERGSSAETKGFCGDYSFSSPAYTSLGDFLYSFDGPAVRRHDPAAPRNTFSGVRYPARVVGVANEAGEVSKEWLSAAVHGSHAWVFTNLYSVQEGGREQQSYTLPAWGVFQQGVYTVAFRRDVVTAVAQGDGTLLADTAKLLYTGRPLQSPWLRWTLEIDSDANVRLEGVTLTFNLLGGQQAVPRP